MDLRRISPAPSRDAILTVVTLDEAKAHARIFDKGDDLLLAGYIQTAYEYLNGPQGWLNGYCILEEEYEFHTAAPGVTGFALPLRPISENANIVMDYYDGQGYAFIEPATYQRSERDGVTYLNKIGYSRWPSHFQYNPRAYRFRFRAGNADATQVPQGIKQAMLLLVAHYYANREAVGADGRTVGEDIKWGVRSLAGRYRYALDHS